MLFSSSALLLFAGSFVGNPCHVAPNFKHLRSLSLLKGTLLKCSNIFAKGRALSTKASAKISIASSVELRV